MEHTVGFLNIFFWQVLKTLSLYLRRKPTRRQQQLVPGPGQKRNRKSRPSQSQIVSKSRCRLFQVQVF